MTTQIKHPIKFIDSSVVREITGASRSTLVRWVKAGTFPQPVALSPNKIAWVEAAVQNWAESRIAASSNKHIPNGG
jgi:predicted DNA-binding transcriptional regulator AlpA